MKKWYGELWGLADKRYWLAATMMVQFAMRNGDVVAADGTYFVRRGEQMYLSYTPHKTSSSSGRTVVWPIHPNVWQRIEEARRAISGERSSPVNAGEGPLVPGGIAVFRTLNGMLRDAVPGLREVEKATYELRKMRIDAEYRHHSAERASALSGDDIRTLSYYYADVGNLAPVVEMAEDLI